METLPDLICGKFTVGGKDNLPPDTFFIIKVHKNKGKNQKPAIVERGLHENSGQKDDWA